MGIPVGKSNIVHHVLKVVDDKTFTRIQQVYFESINLNIEDEVLLELENRVEMWNNLTKD